MEVASEAACRPGRLTVQLNKVTRVTTIARVAAELGEDEDWLSDVANEMEPEDGLIWVYGPGAEGIMAFSDDGIEELKELIVLHKAHPDLLKNSDPSD